MNYWKEFFSIRDKDKGVYGEEERYQAFKARMKDEEGDNCSDTDELKEAIERGTLAWNGVPASWVDELRGDGPIYEAVSKATAPKYLIDAGNASLECVSNKARYDVAIGLLRRQYNADYALQHSHFDVREAEHHAMMTEYDNSLAAIRVFLEEVDKKP